MRKFNGFYGGFFLFQMLQFMHGHVFLLLSLLLFIISSSSIVIINPIFILSYTYC